MKDFFEKTEVLGVLQGFNPWWAGQETPVPEFKRLAYHACRKHLDDTSLRRAVLLSGPRRVGKTTILTQIAADLVKEGVDPRSIIYLSLDHPLLKLLRLPKILDIWHETYLPEGKPAVLLLDEIQYSKDWELELKQLVDRKPQYRILATGSASVVHRGKLSESGVGRWVRVAIPTLSFYEFLRLAKADLPRVPPDLRPTDIFKNATVADLAALRSGFSGVLPLFRRYLLVGGFPETACHSGDIALCQRLLREDVVERVLKRDMTSLFGIRNVADLERLFIYLCIHTGGILAVQTCATALGTSTATVSGYLENLEQANLIYRLAPYDRGGKKALKPRHKVYLVDAALRNAVLLRGEQILSNPEEMSVVVETAVLRHLYAYYYRDTPQILYWRDSKTGKEVDIIVKGPSYVIPQEIKYRENADLTPKEGIVAFCRQETVKHAFWITQQDQDFGVKQFSGIETRFLRIPAHIFLYLLGQAERLLWMK